MDIKRVDYHIVGNYKKDQKQLNRLLSMPKLQERHSYDNVDFVSVREKEKKKKEQTAFPTRQ
jgi:hypothetical protein